MKKTIVLLSLLMASANAFSASILWMDVKRLAHIRYREGDASVQEYLDARNLQINAMQVTISDAANPGPGASSYLLFCYEGENDVLVMDDENATWIPVTAYDEDGTDQTWIPVSLGDYSGESGWNVILQLGYVPDNWDGTGQVPFECIAYATDTIDNLDPHISVQFDLNPPDTTPWAPTQFIAVPEPATCALGLLGAALLLRRRKRTAA
jgi:hypothetical protein